MIMSGLVAVIVLSVLTEMSRTMVVLLSLLCITVSGSCKYHLSVISIAWSLEMLQWRYAVALLCLEMYSAIANTSHPDAICMAHCLFIIRTQSALALHLLAKYYFLVVSGFYCLVLSAATRGPSVSPFTLLDNHLLVMTVSTWGFSRTLRYWPCNALYFPFSSFIDFILHLNVFQGLSIFWG